MSWKWKNPQLKCDFVLCTISVVLQEMRLTKHVIMTWPCDRSSRVVCLNQTLHIQELPDELLLLLMFRSTTSTCCEYCWNDLKWLAETHSNLLVITNVKPKSQWKTASVYHQHGTENILWWVRTLMCTDIKTKSSFLRAGLRSSSLLFASDRQQLEFMVSEF